MNNSSIHLVKCACHAQIPEVRTGHMFFKGNLGGNEAKQRDKNFSFSLSDCEWTCLCFILGAEYHLIINQIAKGVD